MGGIVTVRENLYNYIDPGLKWPFNILNVLLKNAKEVMYEEQQ